MIIQFIHIPKCAGTFIKNLLSNEIINKNTDIDQNKNFQFHIQSRNYFESVEQIQNDKSHSTHDIVNDNKLTCKKYRDKYGDCTHLHIPYFKFHDKNKLFFTIVRNPYNRFVSNYYYDKNVWDKLFGTNNTHNIDTFIQFLHKNKSYIYKHIHLYPQSYFLLDKNNNYGNIDKNIHIFSFESIPYNIKYFFESLNIKSNLLYNSYKLFDYHNKQENINYNLTQEQKNKIYDIYELDFLLLKDLFE